MYLCKVKECKRKEVALDKIYYCYHLFTEFSSFDVIKMIMNVKEKENGGKLQFI